MIGKHRAEELRRRLASADRSGVGRPFPEDLRRAVVEYASTEADSVEDAARDLGVCAMSITRWSRRLMRGSAPAALKRVEVVAECMSHDDGIVLFSRSGLRVEGLTVPSLVEVLRAVG
jgi:transposase-like protein